MQYHILTQHSRCGASQRWATTAMEQRTKKTTSCPNLSVLEKNLQSIGDAHYDDGEPDWRKPFDENSAIVITWMRDTLAEDRGTMAATLAFEDFIRCEMIQYMPLKTSHAPTRHALNYMFHHACFVASRSTTTEANMTRSLQNRKDIRGTTRTGEVSADLEDRKADLMWDPLMTTFRALIDMKDDDIGDFTYEDIAALAIVASEGTEGCKIPSNMMGDRACCSSL